MTRPSRIGLALLFAALAATSFGTLRGVEPTSSAKTGAAPTPSATDGPSSPFATWEGEWTFSKQFNRALGFPETLRRGENHGGMPPAFRLTLDKTLGAGLPEGELEALRQHAFDDWGLKVVATGRWVSRDFAEVSKERDVADETSCYVLQKEGATYVYFTVPYAVVLGGRVSHLQGATPDKDLLAIDFGAEPWRKTSPPRSEKTYVYERVVRKP
jgi:hypothetical protein